MKALAPHGPEGALPERVILRVSVLRNSIAAICNAEGVPSKDQSGHYMVHEFENGSSEAPRLTLTSQEVNAILQRVDDDCRAGVAKLSAFGEAAQADELLTEATIIDGYAQASATI